MECFTGCGSVGQPCGASESISGSLHFGSLMVVKGSAAAFPSLVSWFGRLAYAALLTLLWSSDFVFAIFTRWAKGVLHWQLQTLSILCPAIYSQPGAGVDKAETQLSLRIYYTLLVSESEAADIALRKLCICRGGFG